MRVQKTEFRVQFLICALFTVNCSLALASPQGATFLKIPVGARAAAMGGAFSAVADDASAIYWNPAGLAYGARMDLVASHNQWIAQTNQDFVGFLIKPLPFMAAAAGYLSFASDPIDKRGDQGEKLGTFRAADRAMYASFAMRPMPWIAVGGTVKNIEQTLDDASAKGQAVDLGMQFKPHRKLTLGGSIQNVGPEMRFIRQAYSLPTMIRAGVGFHLSPNITWAADGVQDLNGARQTDWATGLEYHLSGWSESYFWTPVVWRIGYLSPQAPGIGFGMNILGSQIDYAMASVGPLGLTHRVSFHLKFGSSPLKRD